jgi:hypothetical protein
MPRLEAVETKRAARYCTIGQFIVQLAAAIATQYSIAVSVSGLRLLPPISKGFT